MTRRTSAQSSRSASRSAPSKEKPPKRRRGRPPKRETETPDVPGARIIKKYGNRRLYDHTLSRAVTMEELAAAVKLGEDIRVLDGDTGEDLTKRILVQIILEESNQKQLELLPIEFLRELIQLRSEPLSKWISQYLAAGAEWLAKNMNSAATQAGATALRNFQVSLEGLFPWMRNGGSSAPPPSSAPTPEPDRDIAESIDDLQRRLAELTKRFNRR